MNKRDWFTLGKLGSIFVALIGFLVWLSIASCDAKTADIGYANRWGIMQGCQIEVEAGRWIPLDAYYWKADGE